MSASELPWRAIGSGATLEWLVAVLVFLEDSRAKLFGRPGKDGGQDVRSGDGSTVYQTKFHARGTAADAIADAKSEAATVASYRDPRHPRAAQWAGVTHWVLATNVAFNPTDDARWKSEVEPLFNAMGMTARYWGQREVEARVIEHPDVRESFFGGQTRVFFSLPEAKARMIDEEIFARRHDLLTLRGRSGVLQECADFVQSDRRFLLLHGPGGVGKTRLLLEAGLLAAAGGDRVTLWANITSMEVSSNWLAGVPQGRDVVLLVDEPESDEILKVLVEQMTPTTAPMARWKVIVTVRSPKDPVVRYLRSPRLRGRVSEIRLAPLAPDAATALCIDLLQTGPLASRLDVEATGAELARRFGAQPIWMRLAVDVLEQNGDLRALPQTAEELADQYVDEIVSAPGFEGRLERQRLLRWVSMFGTVNVEEQRGLELLAQRAGLVGASEAQAGLAALARRGALRTRGARDRLYEVKPDVLRDHVLARWLAIDVGVDRPNLEPSHDALALVGELSAVAKNASMSLAQRTMLATLARTDFVLRVSGRPVELVAALLRDIERASSSMRASARVFCAEILADVGESAPAPTISLARTLREMPVEPESVTNIFRTRTVGKDDVVLALAWGVFHAAMGADSPELRSEAFGELCALVRAEAEAIPRLSRGLPNDGKRAAALVERTIQGGRNFWGSYLDPGLKEARAVLSAMQQRAPDAGTKALLDAVVAPMTAVGRREEWFAGDSFHIQNYVLLPGDPRWSAREELLSTVKEILESESAPLESRIALWGTFATAHNSANQSEGDVPDEARAPIRATVTAELAWTHATLKGRTLPLEELRAARDVWHWHARFEEDPARRRTAEDLEEIFDRNDLAREFEPLTSFDRWEQHERAARAKAEALVQAGPTEIEAFVHRAVGYLGEGEFHRILQVAAKVGHVCGVEVVAFAKAALSATTVDPVVQFATIILAAWLRDLRVGPAAPSAPAEARAVLASAGSDVVALHVLWRFYGGAPPPLGYENIGDEELVEVRTKVALFLKLDHGGAFLEAITWGLRHDWDGYRALAESVLDATPKDRIGHCVRRLVDGIFWVVEFSRPGKRAMHDPRPLPEGLGVWLLDQLLRAPDLDFDGNVQWHVEQVLQLVGRPDVIWLAVAVRRLLAADGNLPGHHRISKFVAPMTPQAAADASTRAAVADLVAASLGRDTVGYSLPKYLRDIDPDGLVVPDVVVDEIHRAGTDDKRIWRLARIAGPLDQSSPGWRKIARAALAAAVHLRTKERKAVQFALTERSSRAFSIRRGEVPEQFVRAVELARERLESEPEEQFRPLWEAQLAAAEEELRRWQDRAQENE
jgi:hypothetical protein